MLTTEGEAAGNAIDIPTPYQLGKSITFPQASHYLDWGGRLGRSQVDLGVLVIVAGKGPSGYLLASVRVSCKCRIVPESNAEWVWR